MYKAQVVYTDPYPLMRNQKTFGTMPCPIGIYHKSYGYYPTLSWFTAWAVKKLKITGWDGCQSNLMVLPTPFLVHRSSQFLSKEFLWIKLHLVSHHIVCRPCQFVCQRTVRHHEVFLGGFTIIKCPCMLIITPGKFRCFRKSPG